jgi:hypothetical protein
MCFEERVFYRLISGLHAEIAAHSSERYVVRNDDSVQPNLAVYVHWHSSFFSNLCADFLFFFFSFLQIRVQNWTVSREN